ncbi:MAG: hypothetical protein RIQ46_1992 [Pseudomonadota bacterium]
MVHSLFKDTHSCARSFSPPPLPALPSLSRPARRRLTKPLKALPPKPPKLLTPLLALPRKPLTPLPALPPKPLTPLLALPPKPLTLLLAPLRTPLLLLLRLKPPSKHRLLAPTGEQNRARGETPRALFFCGDGGLQACGAHLPARSAVQREALRNWLDDSVR